MWNSLLFALACNTKCATFIESPSTLSMPVSLSTKSLTSPSFITTLSPYSALFYHIIAPPLQRLVSFPMRHCHCTIFDIVDDLLRKGWLEFDWMRFLDCSIKECAEDLWANYQGAKPATEVFMGRVIHHESPLKCHTFIPKVTSIIPSSSSAVSEMDKRVARAFQCVYRCWNDHLFIVLRIIYSALCTSVTFHFVRPKRPANKWKRKVHDKCSRKHPRP